MNMLEMLMIHLLSTWWVLPTWIVAGLALCVSFVAISKSAPQRQRLESLKRQLEVYTEASTRVADTMDQLLRGEIATTARATSSRRYLLQQAKQGLTEGEPLDALAGRLGLCEDEKQLLSVFNGR